jgi:multimeric flavodoxin WrbA
MPGRILGISASPQKGGKVDTILQEILRSSRLVPELVRLHEIRVGPCRACNACRSENRCTVADDWPELQKKIIAADALVIGGWAFSGMIDSATKALMERFWSFRHHRQLTRGKIGGMVMGDRLCTLRPPHAEDRGGRRRGDGSFGILAGRGKAIPLGQGRPGGLQL